MDIEERGRLIERYEGGAGRLRAAVAGVAVEALKWRPAAEEFSVHEVVCHCADSETNAAARIRYLVASPEPVILGYDPMTWATELGYGEHPLEAAMLAVEAARANTAPLLRRLSEEQWSRVGTHTESGAYGAEDWLRIYAEHLEEHVGQVGAVVAGWHAARSARGLGVRGLCTESGPSRRLNMQDSILHKKGGSS